MLYADKHVMLRSRQTSGKRIPIRPELQAALLDAGTLHLRDRPHTNLTLRSLAKVSGVSHTTAAAQFGSMPGYLSALATRSWTALLAKLRHTPVEVVSLGLAYIEFAIEHPHAFRLMNDPGLWSTDLTASGVPADLQRPVVAARAAAFDLFVKAVKQGQADGSLRAGDSRLVARMPAALAHGLALELIDRSGRPGPEHHVHLGEAKEVLYLGMLGLVA